MNKKLFLIGIALLLMMPIGFSAINDNLSVYYTFDMVGNPLGDSRQWSDLQIGSGTGNISGRIGNGRDINTSQYLRTANETKVIAPNVAGYSASTTRGYTIQAWVYYDSIGAGAQDPFGANNATAGGTRNAGYVRGNNANTYYDVRAGAGGETTVVNAHSSTTWYHYVLVYDAVTSYKTLYKQGTMISNVSVGGIGQNTMQNNSWIGLGSPSLTFDGRIDEVGIWNRTLSAPEVSYLYNSGNGRSCSEINCTNAGTYTNATITAYDFYTNFSLMNISVYENNTLLCQTTNGTCYLPYLTNTSSLYPLVLNSTQNGGYFNLSLPSQNVSGSMNFSMSQSIISFTATQYISNATISGVNFTSQYVTNTTQYLTAGTWLINATKATYFTKSQNYTAVALSSASVTIQNMTNTRLNLTVRNAITNAVITSWAVQLNNSAYGHSETQSTTTGALVIDSLTGNWTALIDASGYALTLFNLTLSAGLNNVTVYVYTSESINFFFYNEQTGALITNPNVTIELIGSYASYNRTTNGTGTTYIDLVTPDSYVARYYASGYNPRFSYISVGNRTTQNVSLYLLTAVNGTNISIDVLQQDGSSVQSALVKVLKYDLASNSYIVREQILTDYNGRAYADVLYNQEFYKFIVEYPVGTVALETDPAYITSTTLTLVLDSALSGNYYSYISGAGGRVTFNTATNNFRFTWSDTAGVISQACLRVYKLFDNYTATYLGQNCSTASSGTLLYEVSNATQSQYYGEGWFTLSIGERRVDVAFADLRSNNYFGLNGVLIAVALTITLTFLLIKVSPQAAILSVPLGVTVTNLTGITQFAVWVPFGLFAVSIIIVFAMGRDK